MFERLRRVVIAQPSSPAHGLLVGLAAAAVAVAARAMLAPLLGDSAPFITAFPALLVAALWGGRWGGLTALALCVGLTWWLFMPPRGAPSLAAHELASLAVFAVSGGVIVLVSLGLRRALRDLREGSERERLLVHELQHRVKNNLAIVQSLAAQTARTSGDLDSFLAAFNERLMALARVHNLLLDTTSEGVDLKGLAERSLAPYLDGDHRVTVEGPAACLSAENAVSLALALHELATNAIKYGALSSPRGRVRLSWRLQARNAHQEALIEWQERGGPTPAPSERAGFGSRLLKRGLEGSGRAGVVYDLAPEGLTWAAAVRVTTAP